MKQILQDIKRGDTYLAEVPRPQARQGAMLIKTRFSLISVGTERMLIDFGRANYLSKARQQPEKVKMVLDKIRTDGLIPTIEAVRSKLDQPMPLGYSNVGNLVESDGSISDRRWVSNGHHAEFVCVPNNLCAEVPDRVSDDEASFTVLGSIALQGIRLAQPNLGETFAVIGLGLIGQLTVQLLTANGCQVIGVDYDREKCVLSEKFGAETVNLSKAEDPIAKAEFCTKGKGIDGVLITASTKSNDPVRQAARMCRTRGKIVLVGVTGLELDRSDFFEKELSFQVSCSYGPGRYDTEYEEKGHDYPYGFVRWTEQRNFNAVLQMMENGKLDVRPLISHRFSFDNALEAYDLIARNTEGYLGILLEYNGIKPDNKKSGAHNHQEETVSLTFPIHKQGNKTAIVSAVIGAGHFTGQVILPSLNKSKIRLKSIVSDKGVSGTHQGKKYGFEESVTNPENVFTDSEINTVFITTRHDSHFDFVRKAITSGKHVFVEKPLCLNDAELRIIKKTYLDIKKNNPDQKLMVGFNRRFAPHIVKIKELLSSSKRPKSIVITVNAGQIPGDHWVHDMAIGGGRITGEVCHFVDLLRFLIGVEIKDSTLKTMDSPENDTVSALFNFTDGSIGAVHYFANGNKSFPKERLEVFCEGKILQLDNFRVLTGYGWKRFKKMRLMRQDKGHKNCITSFIHAIESANSCPIPFSELIETTKTTLRLAEIARMNNSSING